mgnify:CR=1 FL=1
MRARGANMTDIAVLVVAADDGIMPQTVESINHAKAANVKIIVAMNKMDKPLQNPERVMEGLTKYGIITEDWGGDVACIPVSALTGMGISDLLERIALEAEVMELKANPNRRAKVLLLRPVWTRARAPSPPFWCRTAPCMPVMSSLPVPLWAVCVPCAATRACC